MSTPSQHSTNLPDLLSKDVERVQRISILSTMLEVITTTTGMGFAAVARVTPDRWIACGVRDEIGFGLKPGGELKVETTICDEIEQSHTAVAFDNVAEDPVYCNHHTPRIYGLQSYISVPIILKDGSFFGTLCAIDPRPAKVNNPKTLGMFNLFAELIAFHLAALEVMEKTEGHIRQSHFQIENYKDEIRQYQHISNHNLQEPLRKIRLFSDQLMNTAAGENTQKVKEIAEKINRFSTGLSQLIRNISDFSGLDPEGRTLEVTDLNEILQKVCERLSLQITEKSAIIDSDILHTVKGMPNQLSRLFYHLLSNALKFNRPGLPPHIRIDSRELSSKEINSQEALQRNLRYCEISFRDNGIGIRPDQHDKIFELFNTRPLPVNNMGIGVGLAQCKKIVNNHNGLISVHSIVDKGTTFSIILPIGV